MKGGIEYVKDLTALNDKMREMGALVAVRTADGNFCVINSVNHRNASVLANAIRMVIDDRAQVVPLELPVIYPPKTVM